jgi:hypothetical protein
MEIKAKNFEFGIKRGAKTKTVLPQAMLRGSFDSSQAKYLNFIKEIEPSTVPARFELPDFACLPIKTFVFRQTPKSRPRERKVMVVKQVENARRNKTKLSRMSMHKLISVEQEEDTEKTRKIGKNRPMTCKNRVSITRNSMSQMSMLMENGYKMFDIEEVLSVANRELDMKQLKHGYVYR